MAEKHKEYKFILIGNTAVGKTAFFRKVTSGIFNEKNISTIGIDKYTLFYENIDIKIDGKDAKESFNIILYDTAGQERYRALAKNYFNSTDVVILLYDITDRKSFDSIEGWLKDVKEKLSDWKTGQYLIFLLGNKLDLIDIGDKKREVTEDEAENFCECVGVECAGECSVKEFTDKELKDLLLKCWKKFVEKFGVKKDLTKYGKAEVKKRKKRMC